MIFTDLFPSLSLPTLILSNYPPSLPTLTSYPQPPLNQPISPLSPLSTLVYSYAYLLSIPLLPSL
jgi:hypothetical protein